MIGERRDRDRLAADLCTATGLPAPLRHEPIRRWQLSGVERLHLADTTTVIFKYAGDPFTSEADHLRAAAATAIPVPAVYAAARDDGFLAMILEDLGEPVRVATDHDAAIAAAHLHRTPALTTAPSLDLAALPSAALTALHQLNAVGRLLDAGELIDLLTALARAADARAAGAGLPPYGTVHGELHPTSLHIGARGWRLLDFAKTFTGPGLLDLATWQGTRLPPDRSRFNALLEGYLTAGGPRETLAPRGGQPADTWALGWHRVWAAAWFLRHTAAGIPVSDNDTTTSAIVQRQLRAAVHLLQP
ncbi:hypothetical protein [Actinoplanes sp. NPDC051494]|uniref:hypothetical protein n=1 Tax=Actinoplanes sp. NPDC051494 TaxID=3363907 RepID=UPI003797D4B1